MPRRKKPEGFKPRYTITQAMEIFVQFIGVVNHLDELVFDSALTQQEISKHFGKSYISLWRKLKTKTISIADVHRLLDILYNEPSKKQIKAPKTPKKNTKRKLLRKKKSK